MNLTFWDASEGGDVLVDDAIPADVVAHVAWHDLTRRALAAAPGERRAPSAEGLFLGESIASAFDLYLVGRLLGHAPESEFLETQVPAMASIAESAGLNEDAFEALMAAVAADPERAFEDLRQLLFDASIALFRCRSTGEASDALAPFDARRFGALLHHYELSTWILYAKAYAAKPDPGSDASDAEAALAIDASLRGAPISLDWLTERWIRPDDPR